MVFSPSQAGKRGVDQGEVCGEKVPEEAGLHGDTHQRREEAGAAVEREEVSAAQQRHHRPQNTAAIPTGGRKHLPFYALRGYSSLTHLCLSVSAQNGTSH